MLPVSELAKLLEYRDGALYWKVSTGRARVGAKAGHTRKDGYVVINLRGSVMYAHRVTYALCFGEEPSSVIDHVDGNPSNNCVENLRLCSHSQNLYNQRLRKDSTTGVKGVYKKRHTRKWQAQLMLGGKHTHIGYFDTKEEAEAAVKKRREQEVGAFARHV